MTSEPHRPKKSILGLLLRLAICGVLMVWIFQSIFWSEGELAWEKGGGTPAWEELSRGERLEISWQHGPTNLWHSLIQIKAGLFALSLLVMGATIFLSVIRWQIVLRVHGLKLPFSRAMEISIVAHFFNAFLLGASGGDLIKAWYAARETHHKKIEAVGTVFVDRLIGLFALLIFACATMPFNLEFLKSVPNSPDYDPLVYRKLAWFVIAMAAGGFVVTLLAFRGGISKGFPKIREWIRRLPKGDMIEKLRDSFLVYRGHKTALFYTLLISLLIHFVAVIHVTTVASGLDLEVTFWQLLTIVPIISCFIILPITANGLGIRENLFVIMLVSGVIGDSPSQALALSLLCFLGTLFWSLIGGVVYATFKDRHHLKEITHEDKSENGAAA